MAAVRARTRSAPTMDGVGSVGTMRAFLQPSVWFDVIHLK
jgi:hypothetical protein